MGAEDMVYGEENAEEKNEEPEKETEEKNDEPIKPEEEIKPEAKEVAEKKTENVLQVGSEVEVYGLVSARGKKLNGLQGKVITDVNQKGRWGVAINNSDEQLSLKTSNLRVLSRVNAEEDAVLVTETEATEIIKEEPPAEENVTEEKKEAEETVEKEKKPEVCP